MNKSPSLQRHEEKKNGVNYLFKKERGPPPLCFEELGFKHRLAFNEDSRGADVAARSFQAGVQFFLQRKKKATFSQAEE